MHFPLFQIAFSGLLLVTAAGCGSPPPRGEVEGTVRRAGRPLGQVVVTFVPDLGAPPGARRASGMSDAQGRFRLRGEDGRADLVAGPYRVIVEDVAVYAAPRAPDGTVLRIPAPRFPARYGDPLQTPVQVQVRPEAQTVEVWLNDS